MLKTLIALLAACDEHCARRMFPRRYVGHFEWSRIPRNAPSHRDDPHDSSDVARGVAIVGTWLKGSQLDAALHALQSAEQECEQAKRRGSLAKKENLGRHARRD